MKNKFIEVTDEKIRKVSISKDTIQSVETIKGKTLITLKDKTKYVVTEGYDSIISKLGS